MKRYIKSSDSSEKIICEDDDIITIAQSNGTATYDKHTGLLLSWEGAANWRD